jgi:hypothetical protein
MGNGHALQADAALLILYMSLARRDRPLALGLLEMLHRWPC